MWPIIILFVVIPIVVFAAWVANDCDYRRMGIFRRY